MPIRFVLGHLNFLAMVRMGHPLSKLNDIPGLAHAEPAKSAVLHLKKSVTVSDDYAKAVVLCVPANKVNEDFKDSRCMYKT